MIDLLPGYRNEDLADAFADDADALVEAGLSPYDAQIALGQVPDWAERMAEAEVLSNPPAETLGGLIVADQGFDVGPGLYVKLADRDRHIQRTYQALSQLGLASRGEAATTQPAAIRRIAAEQGMNAADYLAGVRSKTTERMRDARGAFVSSLGESALQDEIEPQVLGAWVGFRNDYAGPQKARADRGEYTREAYKHDLEIAAKQHDIKLPHIS